MEPDEATTQNEPEVTENQISDIFDQLIEPGMVATTSPTEDSLNAFIPPPASTWSSTAQWSTPVTLEDNLQPLASTSIINRGSSLSPPPGFPTSLLVPRTAQGYLSSAPSSHTSQPTATSSAFNYGLSLSPSSYTAGLHMPQIPQGYFPPVQYPYGYTNAFDPAVGQMQAAWAPQVDSHPSMASLSIPAPNEQVHVPQALENHGLFLHENDQSPFYVLLARLRDINERHRHNPGVLVAVLDEEERRLDAIIQRQNAAEAALPDADLAHDGNDAPTDTNTADIQEGDAHARAGNDVPAEAHAAEIQEGDAAAPAPDAPDLEAHGRAVPGPSVSGHSGPGPVAFALKSAPNAEAAFASSESDARDTTPAAAGSTEPATHVTRHTYNTRSRSAATAAAATGVATLAAGPAAPTARTNRTARNAPPAPPTRVTRGNRCTRGIVNTAGACAPLPATTDTASPATVPTAPATRTTQRGNAGFTRAGPSKAPATKKRREVVLPTPDGLFACPLKTCKKSLPEGIEAGVETHLSKYHSKFWRKYKGRKHKLPCPLCGKMEGKDSYHKHFARAHARRKNFCPYPCTHETCDKRLAAQSSLTRHLKNVHRVQPPKRKYRKGKRVESEDEDEDDEGEDEEESEEDAEEEDAEDDEDDDEEYDEEGEDEDEDDSDMYEPPMKRRCLQHV